MNTPRALEDPVEDGQQLVDRAGRQARVGHDARAPSVDDGGGDVLERQVAQCGKEVRADGAPVVIERGALASPVMLHPPQEVLARVGERHAAAVLAGETALPRCGEDLPQRRLGGSLGQVPGGRPATARPRRPEPLLLLTAVGQPVLHVPLRTAFPIHPEHMARDRLIGDDGSLEHRPQRYRPDRKACPEPCPELGRYVPELPGSLGSRRRFLP